MAARINNFPRNSRPTSEAIMRRRNSRYRRLLNEPGATVGNILLEDGCHLLLESSVVGDPDVYKLEDC